MGKENIMKHKKFFAILCTSAIIINSSGCKSPETADDTQPAASGTTPAIVTEADTAAETTSEVTSSPAGEITSAAHKPDADTSETTFAEVTKITEIDGEEYVIGYTSSPAETTVPPDDTTAAAETTTAAEIILKPTLDDIAMRIESNGAITPDTESFYLYVEYIGSSDTDKFVVGLSDRRLQKYENGKWRDLELPDNYVLGISEYYGLELCKDYPSEKFMIPLVGYKEPVTAGKYRVIKRIGGVGGVDFAEEFEVVDASSGMPAAKDISMKIVSDGAITVNTGVVSLIVTYTGDRSDAEYYTDTEYILEKYNDGVWKAIPFVDEMCFEDIACEIGSNSIEQTFDVTLDNENYTEDLTAGKYRVAKDIGGARFYAEFSILEAMPDRPEGDMVVVGENGSVILDICEIKPDEFICYNYIPLPGKYHVLCDTSKYPDYCVGDRVEVSYDRMFVYSGDEGDDYYIEPESIEPSYVQLDPDVDYKPVIYLYPEEDAEISVRLDYNGRLTLTDPEYKNGWKVTAKPDGTLLYEGREYPNLFWEGERSYELSFNKGFCISGPDTERFLTEKLAYLGLNEKETVNFLEFWLPFMEKNPYNIISFAGAEYTDNAKLEISPSPDTLIRVYMQFTASDTPVDIPEQELSPAPARSGFTVVEWGGSAR